MTLPKLYIYLFISHWPSRIRGEQGIYDRELLGVRLRDKVEDIISFYSEALPNIILLGDYNDEPFDNSLSNCLRASRDINLVRKKKKLLYNPFWRRLGSSQPFPQSGERQCSAGSYFYRQGDVSRWKTFDQIIFSAAFLGYGPWRLIEEKTQILESPFLLEKILKSKEIFDHLPIVSVIEEVIYNG